MCESEISRLDLTDSFNDDNDDPSSHLVPLFSSLPLRFPFEVHKSQKWVVSPFAMST